MCIMHSGINLIKCLRYCLFTARKFHPSYRPEWFWMKNKLNFNVCKMFFFTVTIPEYEQNQQRRSYFLCSALPFKEHLKNTKICAPKIKWLVSTLIIMSYPTIVLSSILYSTNKLEVEWVINRGRDFLGQNMFSVILANYGFSIGAAAVRNGERHVCGLVN